MWAATNGEFECSANFAKSKPYCEFMINTAYNVRRQLQLPNEIIKNDQKIKNVEYSFKIINSNK